MAKPRMDLSAFVGKLLEEQDGDVLREGIRVLSQALMETEVAGLIGADRHERTPERTGHRNGCRSRAKIPKRRCGLAVAVRVSRRPDLSRPAIRTAATVPPA
jgi:transposase-like protein